MDNIKPVQMAVATAEAMDVPVGGIEPPQQTATRSWNPSEDRMMGRRKAKAGGFPRPSKAAPLSRTRMHDLGALIVLAVCHRSDQMVVLTEDRRKDEFPHHPFE